MLDLGLPLVDGNREPFDSRTALAKTPDALKAEKIIPSIPGLFDTESPAPDGILLSHAHLDHAGLLHFSRSTVPIFASMNGGSVDPRSCVELVAEHVQKEES